MMQNLFDAPTNRKMDPREIAKVQSLKVRIGGPDGVVKTLKGRFAWALANLIAAGPKGCTPIEQVGPRWSHYTYVLRREGIAIETVNEKHGGAYSGRHGRYVLHSPVEVLETRVAA